MSQFDTKSDNEGRSNDIPPQSFEPLWEFVDELVATDEDEGCVPYKSGEACVGLIVFRRYDDEEFQDPHKVSAYDPGNKNCFTVQSLADGHCEEIGEYALADDWMLAPPKHVQNRWERYMNQRIGEGVWMSEADPALLASMNKLVDALAANEPVDLHPGTKDVVRDLVHPSLYPLIIDPENTPKRGNGHDRWFRKYEESRFQWLPTEVSISESGAAKFTSPINNLDSGKYPELVNALEQTFTALLPGFESVFQYIEAAVMDPDAELYDGHDGYEVPDRRSFKKLQAVVKIADYSFAPGASFSGVWHYEGMAHENIVMTGLFYPHTDEKLTGGGLEFKRQFTDAEGYRLLFGVSQCRPSWLNDTISEGFVPLGWTTTETGKLMVFPNCHAHRVLDMVNNTEETLRRRLVVFFVVDPDDPIPSSAQHPPMPRKITHAAALADRLELMEERKKAKQDLNPRQIELCEH